MDSKTLLEIADSTQLKEVINTLITHYGSVSNPHSVTKSQVGLANVDNTTDLGKPISTATQAALDLKVNISDLIENNKIKSSYLPGSVDEIVDCYLVSGATALSAGWLSETSGGSALTPAKSKIYVIVEAGDYINKQYRWSGSAYACLNENDLSGYLSKTNTTEFTPDGLYNPATKKYVDDSVNPSISVVSSNGSIDQNIVRNKNIIDIIGTIHSYTTEELAGEDLSGYELATEGKYIFLSFTAPSGVTPDSNLAISVTNFEGITTTASGTEALSGSAYNLCLSVSDTSRVSSISINWGDGNTYTSYIRILENALDTKIDKVTSATDGNLASFDENGNLEDSGKSISDFVLKNTNISAATKCKVTYDAKGLVTAGADLEASDIPNLSISKITDITASATELNYCDGVTSAIQTQLNGKLASDGTAAKATADANGNTISLHYQKKHTAVNITIAVADWAGGTSVTKSVTGITTNNDAIICPSSKESDTTCGNYGVFPTAQGSGTITFTADSTPNAEISLNVFIME